METKIDEETKTVFLPYTAMQEEITSWNKKGYKV